MGCDIKLVPHGVGKVRGDKRQHVPVLVEWTCPKCKARCHRDYSGQHYFSYPAIGKAFEETLCCEECDHEVMVMVTIGIICLIDEGEAT